MSTIPQPLPMLLELPWEIRDMIYTWALKDIRCCKLDSIGYSLTTFEGTERKTPRRIGQSKLPSWFFSNKQILSGAIDTFARGRVFEMEGHTHGGGHARPYEHAILVKSIRILRLPVAKAVRSGLPDKFPQLRIRCLQGRFLQAFMALRGLEAEPLHLIWTWYSDKLAYGITSIPTIKSAELRSLAGRFAKVTITIELINYKKIPIEALTDMAVLEREDLVEDVALLRSARDGLLKHAEEWARHLVDCAPRSIIRCNLGQDKDLECWTDLKILSRSLTVECNLK